MSLQRQIRNKHLLCRAGFGLNASSIQDLETMDEIAIYENLVKASAKKPIRITTPQSEEIRSMYPNAMQNANSNMQSNRSDTGKKLLIVKKNVGGIRTLNLNWLNEMVNSTAQLREKMSFFWHGHFACRALNVYHQELLLQIIRENALGNFGSLLKAVSKALRCYSFGTTSKTGRHIPIKILQGK